MKIGRPPQAGHSARPESDGNVTTADTATLTLYHALIEQCPVGMVAVDPATLRPVEFNTTAHRQLGYTREEFSALRLADLAAETPAEELATRLRQTPPEGAEFDVPLRTKAGEVRDVHVTVRLGGLPDRLLLHCALQDVTEQRQAEQALRRYAQRLSILREVDRAILTARSHKELARGALSRLRRLVPCVLAAISGINRKTDEATLLAVDSDSPSTIPVGTRLPASQLRPPEAFVQGQPLVFPDIQACSFSSPVIKILRDEGIRAYAIFPLIAQEEVIGVLSLGAATPSAFTSEQLEVAREVADVVAIAFQQARLRDELWRHGTQLERRVAARTAELEQANAELNSFAYTVSHDLRAPLRALQGFSQAVLEDYADLLDDTGKEYLRRIASSAVRMDTLVQDLLVYSRIGRAELERREVGLGPVIAEALAQLESELRERHASVTVDEPLPAVVGHHATLVQAVTNLVGNAAKFVAPGITPEVRIRAEARDERVRLWIEDNGIGIAPEHRKRIFNVFERLHGVDTYPGTGIGLAIVRRSVERMGGRVGVESSPGQGSRFWIELTST